MKLISYIIFLLLIFFYSFANAVETDYAASHAEMVTKQELLGKDDSKLHIKYNKNTEDEKYEVNIFHENNISRVEFKIFKCKDCTASDYKDEIICENNKNIFENTILCTAPESKIRNSMKVDEKSSQLKFFCKKLNDVVRCRVRKFYSQDWEEGRADKNALTKLRVFKFIDRMPYQVEVNNVTSGSNSETLDESKNESNLKISEYKNICVDKGFKKGTDAYKKCLIDLLKNNKEENNKSFNKNEGDKDIFIEIEDIDNLRTKCKDIGFKIDTEPFKKCLLQLIKENKAKEKDIKINNNKSDLDKKDTVEKPRENIDIEIIKKDKNLYKLEKAISNCKKLGLEDKSEKFANCILMFYEQE
jgi:hypothetical protein